MTSTVEYTAWPLPVALTRKIIGYFNVYRLTVAVLLIVSHFGDLVEIGETGRFPLLAGGLLIAYLVFALLNLFSAKSGGIDIYRLAYWSLSTDIVFLSALVIAVGGVQSGIGILIVFTCSVAAVLLPMRTALLLASIVSLCMIVTALWNWVLLDGNLRSTLQAGLYGVTAMVSVLIAHRLAYWARDYRLIAEKRKATLSELEQVNELIIRRMRTGVIAVDQDDMIRVMNESAWFHMGSPSVRHRSLKSLSPRLQHSLAEWRRQPEADPKPLILEPSQAQVLPGFVGLPSESGLGALVILNDNNVVARRAVELAVNDLAKLSGSIAHEIRNPLAALNHASQLLEESPQIRLSEMRLIHIIQNHAKRMNGIVENILQLSRREQSHPELVPLHAFLPEFALEFQTSQVNRALDFQTEIDSDEAHVLYDKSQLSQCLWKLLDNAVDHASRENEIARVRLSFRKDEGAGYCVITVADNGPGISETALSKIFEPFYTTRKEGSGLGLYIARQLCEANQAELTVDSKPGEGAFFHIRLALARATSTTSSKPY